MTGNETHRPLVSVGAIVFRGDDVLLVKRGRAPLKGQWSIPGGKVEFGERLEDALRREVMEETGIDIDAPSLIGVFESLPEENGTDRHYVMVDYMAEWRSGTPLPADDADEAEFVALEEARARLSWDKTRYALAMALAARSDINEA